MFTPVDHPSAAKSSAARRAATLLGAAVGPAALWWATGPLAGVEITANTGGGPAPVGLVAVVSAALIAGLAGWGLLAALERRTRCPAHIWTRTAVMVLTLSLAGPLTSSTSGPVGTLALVAMHLITGSVLIGLLPNRSHR